MMKRRRSVVAPADQRVAGLVMWAFALLALGDLETSFTVFGLQIGLVGLDALATAITARDRTFNWIGAMILVSCACYMPVIFFVQQMPLIGMLMIPKTMAYLAIAFLAYRDLFARPLSTVSDVLQTVPE